MEYITTQQAAEKWSVSKRRVQAYLLCNRIEGAVRLGRDWLIPASAVKPEDGRKNNRRKSKCGNEKPGRKPKPNEIK